MKPKKKPNSYSAEFRDGAVKLAIETDQPRSETARDLGINVNTLHSWVGKYQEANRSPSERADQLPMYDELKQLRKENKRLREERDILKKAAAYVASHQA